MTLSIKVGKVSYTSLAILFLIAFIVLAPAMASAKSLIVKFDKPVYDRDDVVTMTISGYSTPATIAIEVHSQSGQLLWVHEADDISTSNVSFSFKLPGVSDGEYMVYVALKGETPSIWEFKVHRPVFRIISLSPTSIEVKPGTTVTLNASVKNLGADGYFKIRVVLPGGAVSESPSYMLAYNSTKMFSINVTAPSKPGTYEYKIQLYNVKYEITDDEKTVQIVVKAPPTTTTPPTTTPPITTTTPPPVVIVPVPVKPPAPKTTTTAVPVSATTTTTVPGAIEAFAASVAQYVSSNGTVTKPIKIVAPPIKTEILIPANTTIYAPGMKPAKITGFIIALLAKSPPTKMPSAKLAGPAIEIKPQGAEKVYFSKPVEIVVPYDPTKVPQGYQVSLAYFNTTLGQWVPLPTVSVNPFKGTVTGLTNHLTTFAAVAFRVAVPVTTTATTTRITTVTTTVTIPVTTTATKTTTTTAVQTATKTKAVTTTITKSVATTVTKTLTQTKTAKTTITSLKTVTITATPITKTIVKTTTSVSTSILKTVQTVTSIKKVTRTPGWAYGAIALVVILAIIAIALGYMLKRGKSVQQQ